MINNFAVSEIIKSRAEDANNEHAMEAEKFHFHISKHNITSVSQSVSVVEKGSHGSQCNTYTEVQCYCSNQIVR